MMKRDFVKSITRSKSRPATGKHVWRGELFMSLTFGKDGAAADAQRLCFQRLCFVRFLRERSNGYVEFIFSIDDPSLGVELILPRAAYDGFCADNRVHFISEAEALDLDLDAQKWRFGIPGLRE
jgi:phenol/toluene 2-monooxygenase (NADH) P0/A0